MDLLKAGRQTLGDVCHLAHISHIHADEKSPQSIASATTQINQPAMIGTITITDDTPSVQRSISTYPHALRPNDPCQMISRNSK